jgi:hypothetical protein
MARAFLLNIQAFILENHFYPTQVEQLAYSTQKHLLNKVQHQTLGEEGSNESNVV